MKKYILLIMMSLFAFGQAQEKAVLNVLSVTVNAKLTSPLFSVSNLVKQAGKSRNWLTVAVQYEVENMSPDDRSVNTLKIVGDFVGPNFYDKKSFYVFSKSLSYSTIPRRGIFYSIFLISPRAIENYFSNASNLAKSLYGRFVFKLNGKTLEDKTVYLVKGKLKKKPDSYSKDKYASEIAPNISAILITKFESPWKNVQYDSFNQLDK